MTKGRTSNSRDSRESNSLDVEVSKATGAASNGEAGARLARYHKLPPDQILVVHDELDLPPGTVRLKFGGVDGGHNGVADVIEKLGSKDFHRLSSSPW